MRDELDVGPGQVGLDLDVSPGSGSPTASTTAKRIECPLAPHLSRRAPDLRPRLVAALGLGDGVEAGGQLLRGEARGEGLERPGPAWPGDIPSTGVSRSRLVGNAYPWRSRRRCRRSARGISAAAAASSSGYTARTTRSRSTVSIARPNADGSGAGSRAADVGVWLVPRRGRGRVEEHGDARGERELDVVADEVLLELLQPVREVAVGVLLAVRQVASGRTRRACRSADRPWRVSRGETSWTRPG